MKAALFDLDGVLIDTEPLYYNFWHAIGKRYGVGGDNFANDIKGTTLTHILDTYFPEDVRADIVKDLEDYESNMEYSLFRGAKSLLAELKSVSIPCAIVTSSNNEKMCNLWLQHPELKDFFKAVITDEDVTKSKPDPQPYIIAAKALEVDPKETWVFEDSINGMISGRRAGAAVVALATTNSRDVIGDRADIIFDTIADISIQSLSGVTRHI